MTSPLQESSPLLTQKTVEKIWQCLQEEGKSNLKFRVSVTGGGCKGMQYQFALDDMTAPDDQQFSFSVPTNPSSNILLVVDKNSWHYLKGTVVDYEESMAGEYFIIRGGQARQHCGCGVSFSTDTEQTCHETCQQHDP